MTSLQPNVCPTDSRHRQDQRELENGQMDRSGAMKHKLEELQRKHRKEREKAHVCTCVLYVVWWLACAVVMCMWMMILVGIPV